MISSKTSATITSPLQYKEEISPRLALKGLWLLACLIAGLVSRTLASVVLLFLEAIKTGMLSRSSRVRFRSRFVSELPSVDLAPFCFLRGGETYCALYGENESSNAWCSAELQCADFALCKAGLHSKPLEIGAAMGFSSGDDVFIKDPDSDLASSVSETDSPKPESRATGFDCKRSALAVGETALPDVLVLLWFAVSNFIGWIFDLGKALVVCRAVVEVCIFDSARFCFDIEMVRGSYGTWAESNFITCSRHLDAASWALDAATLMFSMSRSASSSDAAVRSTIFHEALGFAILDSMGAFAVPRMVRAKVSLEKLMRGPTKPSVTRWVGSKANFLGTESDLQPIN